MSFLPPATLPPKDGLRIQRGYISASVLYLGYTKLRVVQLFCVLVASVCDYAICSSNRDLEVSGFATFSCKNSAGVSRVSVRLIVRKPRFFVNAASSLFIHGSDSGPILAVPLG
jgi:hypothetical protein